METTFNKKDRRILIVDDEEPLRSGLQAYLEYEGYRVDTAASAEEALTLNLGEFDLLLLDVMMGGMSGIELARILKASPLTAGLPIIFLTARDDKEDLVTALNIGADDYVSKPYSARNLVARIGAVLRRTHKHTATKTVG